jgi:cell pole-organizing protein PopZ
MTALAKGSEPSMEEILASIRRIIADDGDAAKVEDPPLTMPEAKAPAPALDLAVEASPAPKPFQAQDDIDLLFAEAEPEPEPEPEPQWDPPPVVQQAPPPQPAPPPEPPTQQLLSSDASAAVAGAFASLSSSLLMGNARTLEDLVTEMLRPMLKTWLDENLPAITERLVKAEIERVARGGR